MIDIKRDSDRIVEIRLGGKPLQREDTYWALPKGWIGDTYLSELPEGESFLVCDSAERSAIVLSGSVLIFVQPKGDNRARVLFQDLNARQLSPGDIWLKAYMEFKRDIIEERAAEVKDVALKRFDDDGHHFRLIYFAEVDGAEKLATVIQTAEQIVAEVEGAAQMRLGAGLWTQPRAQNEKEFTLGIALPILRKLGFHNVRYNHGRREFGRDVLFARLTEFQDLEFWGAQIKFGDVSGAAGADMSELIGQIDDAFKMPFYDLYAKRKQWISKLAIVISGKFTENAIEKICDKIESHVLKNNVVFIDGEKFATLAERFRGTF